MSSPAAYQLQRRALVLDVDGTIVTAAHPGVSTLLDTALRDAATAGWPILFATSRTPVTMMGLGASPSWRAAASVCNGAAELDLATGALSNVAAMSGDFCAGVLDVVAALDGPVEFVAAVADNQTAARASDVRKVRELRARGFWALKVVVRPARHTPDELIALLEDALPTPPAMTWSAGGVVELTAPGTGKVGAASAICARWGVPAADVIAFGDSMNDAQLLAWAGRSVVVGPAPDTLLGLADDIVGCPEQDGVGRYLAALLAGAPPEPAAQDPVLGDDP